MLEVLVFLPRSQVIQVGMHLLDMIVMWMKALWKARLGSFDRGIILLAQDASQSFEHDTTE